MQVTQLIDVAVSSTLFDFCTEFYEPLLPLMIGEEESNMRGGLIDVNQIDGIEGLRWKLSRLTVKEFITTDMGVLMIVVDGTLDEIKELLSD